MKRCHGKINGVRLSIGSFCLGNSSILDQNGRKVLSPAAGGNAVQKEDDGISGG